MSHVHFQCYFMFGWGFLWYIFEMFTTNHFIFHSWTNKTFCISTSSLQTHTFPALFGMKLWDVVQTFHSSAQLPFHVYCELFFHYSNVKLIGFKNNTAMVSSIQRKGKAVVLLSSMHDDKAVDDEMKHLVFPVHQTVHWAHLVKISQNYHLH